jgi:hypothetical protein
MAGIKDDDTLVHETQDNTLFAGLAVAEVSRPVS